MDAYAFGGKMVLLEDYVRNLDAWMYIGEITTENML